MKQEIKRKQPLRKGFSLIELLVVMAVIAILASISFGPLMSYLNKGKIAEIKNECNSIKIAIDSFKDEYGYLPYTGDTYPDADTIVKTDSSGVEFLRVLMGQETTTEKINDKAIEYYSPKTAKGSKNGLLENGTLLDHWRNPYTICLDYDGDGKVDAAKIDPLLVGVQNLEVMIATPGKDNVWGEEEDITSW